VHKLNETITSLAGASESGYREGIGVEAQFNKVEAIVQLEDRYIVSDKMNSCLRSISYHDYRTSTYAGECTKRRERNIMFNDASLLSVKFFRPRGMATELRNDITVIYLVDDDALWSINTAMSTITTLSYEVVHNRYQDPLSYPFLTDLVVHPAGGLLLSARRLPRQLTGGLVSFRDGKVRWVTGGHNHSYYNHICISSLYPSVFCTGRKVSLDNLYSLDVLKFLLHDLLIIYSWRQRALALLNLTSGAITPLCDSLDGSRGVFKCDDEIITSLAVDNETVYIGTSYKAIHILEFQLTGWYSLILKQITEYG